VSLSKCDNEKQAVAFMQGLTILLSRRRTTLPISLVWRTQKILMKAPWTPRSNQAIWMKS